MTGIDGAPAGVELALADPYLATGSELVAGRVWLARWIQAQEAGLDRAQAATETNADPRVREILERARNRGERPDSTNTGSPNAPRSPGSRGPIAK